jgi:single-strand DNA-binding protein
MSNDLNLCQFIGRAGRDPELRYLPSGEAVANFSIAVGWKGKDKEGTEWVRCNAFGRLAEIVGEYVNKGKQVYVAGRMSTRKWTDKDGVDKYTTEINVDRLQLLGGRDEGAAPAPAPSPRTHGQMRQGRHVPEPDPGNGDDMDDMDIPF